MKNTERTENANDQGTSTDGPQATSATNALVVAFLALFTDMLIYGIAVPILPQLAVDIGAGPAVVGFLFASYALGFLATTAPAGRLVDRYGPRRSLLIGIGGLAIATVLFGVGEGLSMLLLARLLQGISAALSWVAALALVSGATPIEARGRSFGIAISGMTTGLLAGPPLGGFLASRFGPESPFFIAAGLALVVGMAYLALVRGSPAVTDDPAGPRDVLRVRGTAPVIVIAIIAAATIAIIEPVLPLTLRQQFGLGSTGVGLLFGLTVVVGIALAPIAGSLIGRVRIPVLVGTGAVLAGAALVVLGTAASIWHVALGMVLLGMSYGPLLQTPATVLIGVQGQRSDPPALGGSYALYNIAFGAGLFLGPLIGSVPTGLLGFTTAMVIAGVVVAVAGLVGATRLPSLY